MARRLPKRERRRQVFLLHRERPDWTLERIAEAAGMAPSSGSYVSRLLTEAYACNPLVETYRICERFSLELID